MRRLSIVLIVAAGVATIGAGSASAHKIRYESDTNIVFEPIYAPSVFAGQVSSTKSKCERNRQVNVRQDLGHPNPLYGTGFTNNGGNWEVNGTTPVESGEYFAKVRREVLKKSKGHKHICQSGRSERIDVP